MPKKIVPNSKSRFEIRSFNESTYSFRLFGFTRIVSSSPMKYFLVLYVSHSYWYQSESFQIGEYIFVGTFSLSWLVWTFTKLQATSIFFVHRLFITIWTCHHLRNMETTTAPITKITEIPSMVCPYCIRNVSINRTCSPNISYILLRERSVKRRPNASENNKNDK